jgi:hypothetical protein
MIWFGAMYWNPAIPPIAAVSIDILKKKIISSFNINLK